MSIVLIVLGVLLLIASVFDLKFKSVPSVFLTAMVFTALMLRPDNLVFGVLAVLLILIVKELSNEEIGVADFKVMAVIGLLISTTQAFFSFTLVFVILQLCYIGIIRQFTNYDKEIPFIPCLFAIYVGLALSGVLI